MPEPRRIVPDASVLLPAHFPEVIRAGEEDFRPAARASAMVAAVSNGSVTAFAPDILVHEFLKRAYEKARPRSAGAAIEMDAVESQVNRFLQLPIAYVHGEVLADLAWWLVTRSAMSLSDSWYLACAIHYDAELWVSHPHRDGFVQIARRHHERVFCLSERGF